LNYLFVAQSDISTINMGLRRPGISYVAASLKVYNEGVYNVYGVDLSFYLDEEKTLEYLILKNRIDVVCAGALSAEFNAVSEIFDCVKRIKPEIITVLGGAIVTTTPELVMKNMKVDFGVIGQGEVTICQLADALKDSTDISDVDGLIYFDNGELVKTKERAEFKCINNLNYPLYDIFDFEKALKVNPRLDITASRSCPFNCTFCYHPSGKKYVQRNLDSIFDEIDYWMERYPQIKYLGIVDECFAVKEDRILEFCERIKRYRINFRVQLRAPDVNEIIVKSLSDAGCDVISIGLESADDSILKSMKKHITLAQIEPALELIRKYNISIEGNFIFGDIAETMETANSTYQWWFNHLEYNINLSHIRVFPGTEIYRYAVENNIIKDELEFLKQGCPVINVSELSKNEFDFISKRLESGNKLTDIFVSRIRLDGYHEDEISKKWGAAFKGTAECAICGTWNEFDFLIEYFNKRLICSKCRTRLDFRYDFKLNNDILRETCDNIFDSFTEQGKTVYIWGATERTQNLLLSFKNLRKCTKKIIDKNYKNMQKMLEFYNIESPEILKNEVPDCIVIVALLAKDEITSIIRNVYKLEVEIIAI
jgi:radical SAM superfamily enzyme YgiQ (UPF0313 family)